MAAKLTPIAVEKAKTGSTRREIPDAGCAHLYLLVQPSGRKSWACRYRLKGSTAKLTLGAWPAVSLAEARRLATAAIARVAKDEDPAAEKRQAKAEAADRDGDTVAARAAKFIDQQRRRTRPHTAEAIEGIFRRDVLPAWGKRSVHDIQRRDVIDLVERIAETRPVMANRVHSVVSKFFNFLLSRDVITTSPVVGVSPPTKEKARERVLNDGEVARFWKACDTLPAPFGAIYRLLLLSGARRQEAAEIEHRELDKPGEPGRAWRLPGARSKNHEGRAIPLPRQAWEIIDAQPRIVGSPFVFVRRSGFSHIKPVLDRAMQPDVPFVTHDLRRACASGLQKVGTDIVVTEKILGHKSGSFRGVVGVYQKHDYLDEARVALQAWADHIDALVKGESVEVLRPKFRRR
jgi:integrase